MITIESINKKLGFDILMYKPEPAADTEYDAPRESIFLVLSDEEVSFLVKYFLERNKVED